VRHLAEDMDPAVVAEVDRRLAAVAAEHDVRVPWAIESGSRAWGFASPDSDYDCRFLYVRPAAAYLDPWPRRDVVETPLDAVHDVNGWDLVKALRLAVKGNATVSEWLRSPIVYDGDAAFRDLLLDTVNRVAPPGALVRHYRSIGSGQWARSGATVGEDVWLKGVFYALRPAATLHWLATRQRWTPPMALPDLLADLDLDPGTRTAVEDLVAHKAVTRELGTGQVPGAVRRYVEHWLAADVPTPAGPDPDAARRLAGDTFRTIVGEWPRDGR
jgi:predicted nucleotidyltransferase